MAKFKAKIIGEIGGGAGADSQNIKGQSRS